MNLAQALHLLKLLTAAIVTAAGSVLAAHLQGLLVLPPSVVAILTSITAVGAGLGIASSGVTPPAPAPLPTQPEVVKLDPPPGGAQ